MLTQRWFAFAFTALGLMSLAPAAHADAAKMMECSLSANAVVTGHSSEFYVRFDRPVDHVHSVLTITNSGKVVQTLHPRLESAPDVLFARTTPLAAGDYQLHWSVKTMAGNDVTQGDIPFSVKS